MDLNTVYIIISIISVVLGGVWFMLKKIFKTGEISVRTEKIPELEKKISEMPCNSHGYDIKTALKNIITLQNSFCDVSRWIAKFDSSMIDVFLPKKSPRKISEAGYELLKETCAQKIIDDNLDFFISEIEKQAPKTAYDLEESSFKVLTESSDKDIFNCIKNYVYFNPEEMEFAGQKSKIDFYVVIRVMSVYLRDKYINKHPELIENFESEFVNPL
ncbi:MAG: hypothetical protein LBP72_01090 [Dysgonamonadaceae bacterium]|jgi:hypothetical protein|nr:hypothetical protein [Dysgonamonadaceae bacterium]